MPIRTQFSAALAFLLVASGLVAQDSCPSGPGVAFGIVSYQCANCGFKHPRGERPSYQFFAEPVVLEVSRDGSVAVGDVIEAVNGLPITTTVGARQFTYPPTGDNKLTVRRGRDHYIIHVAVAAPSAGCDIGSTPTQTHIPLDDVESIEVLKGSAATTQYGADAVNGVVVITTKSGRIVGGRTRITVDSADLRALLPAGKPAPLVIVDGVPVVGFGRPPETATGRYGFAVACKPSCTAVTGNDGPLFYTYYKYDGLPPIAAVRSGSPADRAGLKIGDLVTRVDGVAIGDEEGAKGLARLDRRDAVRITVRRGDKETEFTLRIDR